MTSASWSPDHQQHLDSAEAAGQVVRFLSRWDFTQPPVLLCLLLAQGECSHNGRLCQKEARELGGARAGSHRGLSRGVHSPSRYCPSSVPHTEAVRFTVPRTPISRQRVPHFTDPDDRQFTGGRNPFLASTDTSLMSQGPPGATLAGAGLPGTAFAGTP